MVVKAEFPFQSKYLDIGGSKIHYVEQGKGADNTVLFLHGCPTSSYLWRNITCDISPDVSLNNTGILKELTGNDLITGEYKFKNAFKFRNQAN